MLHIILMILKILGILILSILGFGLCIGLLVLFCPIRYDLEGSIYGKPKGHVRVSWLLRLVSVTFSYQENKFAYKFCIFGIRLRKRKKKEQQKEQEKKQEIEQKAQSKQEKKKNWFFKRHKGEKITEEEKSKEEEKLKEEKRKEEKLKEEDQQALKRTEELQESVEEIESKEKEKQKDSNIEESQIEIIEEQSTKTDEKEVIEKQEEESELQLEAKRNWKELLGNIISGVRSIPDKIKGIFTKIKEVLSKIKGIFIKIKETFFAIKTGIQKFLALLKDLNKKRQAVLIFIKDEKNKEAFRYTRGKLFQLLCHVLPGKVTLRLHYGFEDPATTGLLTGMIFMFYPRSAEKFQLMPDFENRVFEGELMIKGRVRLGKVLWILLSIYFHKECNRIIKMIIKR